MGAGKSLPSPMPVVLRLFFGPCDWYLINAVKYKAKIIFDHLDGGFYPILSLSTREFPVSGRLGYRFMVPLLKNTFRKRRKTSVALGHAGDGKSVTREILVWIFAGNRSKTSLHQMSKGTFADETRSRYVPTFSRSLSHL